MQAITFSFENSNVRTAGTPECPLFVATDVASVLGYSNIRKAIYAHVDEEDRIKAEIDTDGGRQTVNCVNESGLYALIFGSKLESAKRFKRWVTSEVLPAIRKTGRYEAPKTITPAQQFAIRAAVDKAAHANSLTYQAIYKALYAKYSIPRYTELLQTDFDDALAFIQECAPKKKTKALPVQPGTELTPKELEDLMNVLYQLRYFFRPELKAFHRFFDTRLCFGYASCVGRNGRRGLGGPNLRRVAASRSIERRFCWLRADAPLKQGCIEVSAYERGLWGTERCAVP